ncbi:MAG: diacylglycerol/lipid kinase family protein [Schwartzia sp. (in: firmicutes)]
MKRFALVYNPVSGHAALRRRLDFLIEAFQRRGCMLIPYRTRAVDREMGAFLREASPDGVIAAGGDGTLKEVVNVILREKLDVPIAIIGSGTSNDFVSHLGVNEDLERYFDHIVAGSTIPCDVGRVGEEYFVNVASAGMLTSVAHEVSTRLKSAMGKAAYYLRGLGELPRFHTMRLHIEADGTVHEVAAYFFVIVNSTIAAGLKNVAPLAKLDDGKLDMLVVRQCSLPEFMALAASVIAGRIDPHDKNILYLQGATFRVEADESAESDLDGERGPHLPLLVETVPQAIRLFV